MSSPPAPPSLPIFRDPAPVSEQPGTELARLLFGSSRLPHHVPIIRMNLLYARRTESGPYLVFGHEDPMFALHYGEGDRLEADEGEEELVRPSVEIEIIHDEPRSHEAAHRLRGSLRPIPRSSWERATRAADHLEPRTIGPAIEHFRQVAPATRYGIVRTGFRCNQDCGMCWQDRSWPAHGPEQVKLWIEDVRRAGKEGLIISGGEPLIDPHFFEYLALARDLGFQSVMLETNAIQFSKPGFAERVVEIFPVEMMISLHSGDPATSDRITGAPGTFVRTIAGIHKSLSLGLPVSLNLVITRESLVTLPNLPDFLHEEFGHYGRTLFLNASSMQDSYSGIGLAPDPDEVKKYLPAFVRRGHELGIDLSGVAGTCGTPLCDHGVVEFIRTLPEVDMAGVDWRVHLPLCDECTARSRCFGVRKMHVDRFGDTCISPIRTPI